MSSEISISGEPDKRAPDLGRFRVGDWIVSRAEGMLSDDGRKVRLEPRVMDVLVYLAARPGEVVFKEEILQAVWKGCFVEDGVLSQAVHNLRRALGDDARQPQYIQTLPKRGYRLLAAIAAAEPPATPGTPVGPPPTRAESSFWRTQEGRLLLSIFGGAAAIFSWLAWKRFGAKAPAGPAWLDIAFIDRTIDLFCRRSHLSGPEAEDFRQWVYVKLMEDDFKVLRSFRAKGTLKTYLITVIQRHLLDWRNRKWRPSAGAQRLGGVSLKLEELIRRDGLSVDEACETLLTNHHVDIPRAELERINSLLPLRTPRQLVGYDELDERPVAVERPEERVLESELGAAQQRLLAALEKALGELAADDRLVVEMCDLSGRTIPDAARFLCLSQEPLYRRREQILARLRRSLETEGFWWKQVSEIFGISEVRSDCTAEHRTTNTA